MESNYNLFNETITLGNLITIVSGILFWGSSLVYIINWLNKKFEQVLKENKFTEFINTYEKRHTVLGRRLYNLEIWAASKNGPHPKYVPAVETNEEIVA